MVCPALAGVNSSNIVFGFLAFHGFNHGFVIPEIRLGYKPALVMVFNPKDQGLEPSDLHCTEDLSLAVDGRAAMCFAISVTSESLFNRVKAESESRPSTLMKVIRVANRAALKS
jgi:hypothetical protein